MSKKPKEKTISVPDLGEFSSWRMLRGYMTRLEFDEADKKLVYDRYVRPGTCCSCPGCTNTVPYEHVQQGACCTTHYNYARRIKRGTMAQEDIKLVCHVCGAGIENIAGLQRHLRGDHGYDDAAIEQYYRTYMMTPDDPDGHCLQCGKPTKFTGLAHGYRKFCYNTDCNVRWYNEHTDRLEKFSAAHKERLASGDVIPTQVGYWVKKGYTLDAAIQKVAERQRTGTIESIAKANNCSLAEARKLRIERTQNWVKKFAGTGGFGYSRASQVFFWMLWEDIRDFISVNDVSFATFDHGTYTGSKNLETQVTTATGVRLLDFYIKSLNIVVEYDGMWFHRYAVKENITVEARKQRRDAEIEAVLPGVRILHIDYTSEKLPPTVVQQLVAEYAEIIRDAYDKRKNAKSQENKA